MRRVCSYLIASVSVLVLHGVGAADLLQNATFQQTADTGNTPAVWSFADFGTGGTPLYQRRTGQEPVAVGIQCATAEQRGAWRQRVELGGQRFLHISGSYRTEGVAPTAGRGAVVRLTFLSSKTKWQLIDDSIVDLEPSEGWRELRAVVPVPDGAVVVWPELFNFFAPGKVWWANMELREATSDEAKDSLRKRLDGGPDPNQVPYQPADGTAPTVNPPAFTWVPAEGVQEYIVQYSRSATFPAPETTTVRHVSICAYVPHEPLEPGEWHWRYGFEVGGGETVFSRARSFTVTQRARIFPRPRIEDVLKRIPRERPRVYVTPTRLARIRGEPDGPWANVIASVVRSAESQIGRELYPEPQRLPKSGQERSIAYQQSFRTMRPFTAGMERCALAYALTGERRFGEEARRRLVHYASWDPEGPTSMFHNDEAGMDIAMRGPRTFDWIWDLLSEEERQKCIEVFRIRLGQIRELHRRLPFESRTYGSHQGRMVGFLGEGSIVFAHEIPEAKQWLDYILTIMWSVYPAWGSADGGWAQGMSYWRAYIGMLVPFAMVLQDYDVPYDRKPFLENTGYFGLYCAPPFSKVRPYGDGHEGRVGGGDGQLLYQLSSVYRNPYFRWYAETIGSGPGSGAASLIALDVPVEAKPPSDLPQARNFPRIGWVAMHSNLAEPENNVHFMLKSSPYGSYSHSHASQNAFIINGFGEPLAISSGYYQRYGSPHHSGWTRETRAHNSITVDGIGQKQRSMAAGCHIADFDNTEHFAYAVGDATDAYEGRLKRFLRYVLFARPDYFVIYDDLESAQASQYEWWLHAKSRMSIDEAQQSVTVSEGEARLLVRLVAPAGLRMEQTDQFDVQPLNNAANQWHFTASTTEKAAEARFLTALVPYRAGDEADLPRIAMLECEGGFAVQLESAAGRDIVAFRVDPAAWLKVADIETDMRVVAVRRSPTGEIRTVFGRGGTTIRVAGTEAMPET